jgi:hypothetical protein
MINVLRSLSLRKKIKHFDEYKQLLTTPEMIQEVFSNDNPSDIAELAAEKDIGLLVEMYFVDECMYYIARNNNWKLYTKYITSENVNTAFLGACDGGHIELIYHIHRSYPKTLTNDTIISSFPHLAKINRWDVLQHFVSTFEMYKNYLLFISENGSPLNVLQWLITTIASCYLSRYVHIMARNNHLNFIEFIFDNSLFDKWEPSVYAACRNGAYEVACFLLDKFPHYTNNAFVHACKGGHVNIVDYMTAEKIEDWNMGFAVACYRGHYDMVKYLFRKEGAVVNLSHAFCMACYNGHLSVVELLLNKPIPREIRYQGYEIACAQKHSQVMNLLFKHSYECSHCEVMDEILFETTEIRENAIFN